MEDATTAIIYELADEKGVAPEEITEPLSETIDPDALNSLLDSGSVRVAFEYDGDDVRVTSSGEITVDPKQS